MGILRILAEEKQRIEEGRRLLAHMVRRSGLIVLWEHEDSNRETLSVRLGTSTKMTICTLSVVYRCGEWTIGRITEERLSPTFDRWMEIYDDDEEKQRDLLRQHSG